MEGEEGREREGGREEGREGGGRREEGGGMGSTVYCCSIVC